MKFALRTALVIVLTYVYLRLIYLSDWIDEPAWPEGLFLPCQPRERAKC